MTSDLARFSLACRERTQRQLELLLPVSERIPTKLHQAMRYATLSNGKRIRPLLAYAAGATLNTNLDLIDTPAAAVELIHSYSLIHDDLPAMDDDNLRRGQPTCHLQFDEATAILAGDALQALAFQVLSDAQQLPFEHRIEMLNLLASAAGHKGMVGGQALDLDATGKQLTQAELEHMHIHKTGALIRASVLLGGLCSPQLNAETRQALDRYAKCIGLAFQIIDDVLDVTGDSGTLGKTSGKDAVQYKSTFPDLMGIEGARTHAEALVSKANQSLELFGTQAELLKNISVYILKRSH